MSKQALGFREAMDLVCLVIVDCLGAVDRGTECRNTVSGLGAEITPISRVANLAETPVALPSFPRRKLRKWLREEQSSLRLWQQVPDPVATSEMASLAHPGPRLGNGFCGTSHMTTSGK